MKKLVLLGDSIRMIGYGTIVPEILKEEFETWQPNDNGRFSKYTLRYVSHEWVPNIEGADIIHWNNGIWDVNDLGDGVFTSKSEYVENMTRIANQLLKLGKKVIFATITPVNEPCSGHSNERIAEYNKLIVPVLEEKGIIINDLFSVVYPHRAEYLRDDHLHLAEKGAEACAEQTVRIIREVAKTL
jgi:hypothetical protein